MLYPPYRKTNGCKRTTGYLLVLVLVFGSIFFMIVSSFIGFLVTENRIVNQRVEILRARDIAEAGLNYYKWFLAHYPDDTTNGTGLSGPYMHEFVDPEVGPIGRFELSIASTTYCGEVSGIEVSSTGYTYDDPSIRRTVTARYSRPSLANYAFITNAGVWYGAASTVVGPVHSNQGIRMDAAHNSAVTSGFEDWSCDSSYGCTPTTTVPGVYTTSGFASPGLFDFPVTQIDFEGRIAVGLANLKDRASNHGGIYLPKTPSGSFGYRIVFNTNDTITVRTVTGTTNYWSYSTALGWHNSERNVIASLGATQTYTVSPSCPVIFVEDKAWIQGSIPQKITLAAADLNDPSSQVPIVIQGNLLYTSGTSSGLLAIAEGNVDLGLNVSDNLTVNGIFVAQNGRFGRNYYCNDTIYACGSYILPTALRQYVVRNQLTIQGTIASHVRAATRWTSGGTTVTGFSSGITTYDRNQVDFPPPYVPHVTDVYEFSDWREDGN